MKPTAKSKKRREDQWTLSLPVSLRRYAIKTAKLMDLRGGASELVRRLIVAESMSKKGIAIHHPERL